MSQPITPAAPEPVGLSEIEAKILAILTEREPADSLPSSPMLEWIEAGAFTCMRVNLVDAIEADQDGFTPIWASALVLADVIHTEPNYHAVIAANLRLSLRIVDGRVPNSIADEW